MSKTFRTRVRGSPRQVGKAFPVLPSHQKLSMRLPKLSGSFQKKQSSPRLRYLQKLLLKINQLDKKEQEADDKIQDIESQFDVNEYQELKYKGKKLWEEEKSLRNHVTRSVKKLSKENRKALREYARKHDTWYPIF